MEIDDDIPQLSAETFVALQEFYKEQEERDRRFGTISTILNESVQIDENWQLSQFWYDEDTINKLVQITLNTVGRNGKIALVSCPSLYKKMNENLGPEGEVTLYEYDERFAIYGKDFVFYDYKAPLSIPMDRASYYDIILADPPFLSDECLTKTAITVKFLTKHKIILCTGATMADLANRLLDLKQTPIRPKHKNNLANEFWCFSNFNLNES